ncbi:MAG: aspartate dehydrogenase [Candidatus Omnitrophota bacterium]|nr:aspartate dehydrogenase [Candidatus Omnitrophota bacterium]
MNKIKVGIVGCGTIGSELAFACQSALKNSLSLVGICDKDGKKSASLKKSLKGNIPVLELDGIIKKADLVVEAASASVSADILKKTIKHGKDILIMSVGGLLGNEGLLVSAAKAGIKVYLPSGALSGIDGLKSASAGKLESVVLTTRKPVKGLEGAPYLREKNIKLSDIKNETVIFDGNANEAIKGFPQNVNVCAVLSLAGIGADKTRVRIVTSPDYTKNVHEVEITGDFGKISTRTESVPSKSNPKTSYLAALSAIATLGGVAKSVQVGT